jgi:hypothetical protein
VSIALKGEFHVSKLKRNLLRFEPECQDRLDEIADFAGTLLHCEVSRAAVVRAAVQAWLTTNTGIHPEQLIEAIRGAIMKRGRKRRGSSPSPPGRGGPRG